MDTGKCPPDLGRPRGKNHGLGTWVQVHTVLGGAECGDLQWVVMTAPQPGGWPTRKDRGFAREGFTCFGHRARSHACLLASGARPDPWSDPARVRRQVGATRDRAVHTHHPHFAQGGSGSDRAQHNNWEAATRGARSQRPRKTVCFRKEPLRAI